MSEDSKNGVDIILEDWESSDYTAKKIMSIFKKELGDPVLWAWYNDIYLKIKKAAF